VEKVYRAVLLVYDGTSDSLVALREGARIAKTCESQVFVLAVATTTPGILLAQMTVPGLFGQQRETYEEILAEGMRQLRGMGFAPTGRLASGDPGEQITAVAVEFGVDLVVVGHRRRGGLSRLWNSSVAQYLVEHLDCSLLVTRVGAAEHAFRGRTTGYEYSNKLLGRRE